MWKYRTVYLLPSDRARTVSPLLNLLQLQQSDMQVVLIFSSNAWLEDKVPKNVIALKVVLLYQLDWQPDLRSHLKDNTSVLLFSYAGITKGVRL